MDLVVIIYDALSRGPTVCLNLLLIRNKMCLTLTRRLIMLLLYMLNGVAIMSFGLCTCQIESFFEKIRNIEINIFVESCTKVINTKEEVPPCHCIKI